MKQLAAIFGILLMLGSVAYANNGGPQGGGPGNSGNGDKSSCVEGPPDGQDPCF